MNEKEKEREKDILLQCYYSACDYITLCCTKIRALFAYMKSRDTVSCNVSCNQNQYRLNRISSTRNNINYIKLYITYKYIEKKKFLI